MADKRITDLTKASTVQQTDEVFLNNNGVPKWILFSKLVEVIKNSIGSGGTESGEDGGYYQPSVSSSGVLSWTASKHGMPSVESSDIKGVDGYTPAKGVDYWTTADQNSIKSYCKDYIDTNLLGGAS